MATTYLYFLHALSPLHAGTGQGSGVIDLPIAREKATGIPYLPGSSVKGVLRDKSGDEDVTYLLLGQRLRMPASMPARSRLPMPGCCCYRCARCAAPLPG
ncbi:RAMP superfamily CRISPR-associated protein [Chloroflexus sp.]|uniref:RAMP superfamily CRISPR-associated protein n=1 Tax=Chloroflexus sp. TaxID=1904827 RepID=UPI0026052458|nr:RAMP superfamily CRISPR-associated protein [uncultured Chloroflexus sp.]